MTMRTTIAAAALTLIALINIAIAQQPQDTQRAEAAKQSHLAYERNQKQYANDPDMMVRPGLLADRKAQTVKLWSMMLPLTAGDPVEFLLIPANSGKDYEALAITFAKLDDVNKALQFIGLKPGRAVDYPERIYWARGPDMMMTLGWTDAQGKDHQMPIQSLLRNPQTGAGWDQRLVYTGSRTITTPDGQQLWLADADDAGAVASTYSNPAGLLDVAARSPQGDVYGTIKPLEKMPIEGGQPMVVTLSPSGKAREINVTLTVKPIDDKMRVDLVEAGGLAHRDITWVEALDQIAQTVKADRVPFVTVNWADDLLVTDAEKAAALLGQIEGPKGIRVEPPATGKLFYRAFLPNPKWRDPAQRVFHGWDVTLPADPSQPITAVERADVRDEQTGVYSTVAQSHTAADPQALSKLLQARDGQRPRDVYVHVPPSMTCGQLETAIAPSLPHHPTVYVFVD